MKLLKVVALLAVTGVLLQPATLVSLTINKAPSETFNVGLDFSQIVGASAISFVSVTVLDQQTGQNVTSQLVAASPVPGVVPSTKEISWRVQGGTTGHTYLSSTLITNTVTGEKWEGQISFIVVSGQ